MTPRLIQNRTGKASPLINREEGRDRKCAFGQPTIETDTRRVVGELKVGHHLIDVGKYLGKSDRVDEPNDA